MVGVRPLAPAAQAFGLQALLQAASRAGAGVGAALGDVAWGTAADGPAWNPGEAPPKLVFTDVAPGSLQWAAYTRALSRATPYMQVHAVLEVTSPAQAARLAARTRELECTWARGSGPGGARDRVVPNP
jgi:hypothetical protein